MSQQTLEPAAPATRPGREAVDTVADLGITLTQAGRRPERPAAAPPSEDGYATVQLFWPGAAE